MRIAVACLTAILLAGCARAPTGAVSGTFTADGKPVVFTDVTAQPMLVADKQVYVDGQPSMYLVFTTRAQGGDADAQASALAGRFGDAMVMDLDRDGSDIGWLSLLVAGQQSGADTGANPLKFKTYNVTSGQIVGELTSGGPIELSGHKLNVDLTFRTKAP